MTEEKVKKREWVKTAAIIFLSVLLVLTFFSNTILNWSLPEVAVKYVSSGSISAQIRGTGTVTAQETYEVVLDESRKIQTVYAKAGESVSAGDLLFVLSDEDSDELESARESLQDMQLAYRKALLDLSSSDYASENRNIQRLTEQIEKKTAEMDAILTTDADYAAAKQAVENAETAVDAAEDALDDATDVYDEASDRYEDAVENLSSVSEGTDDTSAVDRAEVALGSAESAQWNAEAELEGAKLVYGAAYARVTEAAEAAVAEYYDSINGEGAFDALSATEQQRVYRNYRARYLYAAALELRNAGDEEAYEAYEVITEYQSALDAAEAALAAAQVELDNAENAYNDANAEDAEYQKYKKERDAAKTALNAAEKSKNAAEKALTRAQEALEDAKADRDEIKADLDEKDGMESEIETLEDQLADAIFNLARQQADDSVTSQKAQLDLEDQLDSISTLREKVEKLERNAYGAEIYSDVNGVVQSVNISAGGSTTPGNALAVIEVPDLGYYTELSVTSEQARRVTTGDYATVSTGWYGGGDITARLAAIRTDPQNPRTGRLLVFELSGADVTSGESLTLSIGEKSTSYATIIPRSALRSDTNGSFVLMIQAKNTPLGNRYYAQRVDVTVLAEDDVNCAVSGALTDSDCVITTASAPVESGVMVRMAET